MRRTQEGGSSQQPPQENKRRGRSVGPIPDQILLHGRGFRRSGIIEHLRWFQHSAGGASWDWEDDRRRINSRFPSRRDG